MLASLSATAGYLGFSPTLAPRAQRTHVDMVAAPPRATPKATGSGKPDPLEPLAPPRFRWSSFLLRGLLSSPLLLAFPFSIPRACILCHPFLLFLPSTNFGVHCSSTN